MAVNKVNFGGNTLIDLTGDTLESAEQLLKGIIAHAKDGSVITGQMEAGGGGGGENIDWRGFPVLTGTFTPSEDISSDYVISMQEGERLHYKTMDGAGAKWKPMFLLFPDTQYIASNVKGYIQNIGNFPNTDIQRVSPNNTGAIFAYTDDDSVNTTYVKGVYSNSFNQTGFTNGQSYQQITITSVKIPAKSSLKLKSGLTYRWLLFANIYAEEVSIV